MDLYVHIAVGAVIGVVAKSTADLVFPDINKDCEQSVSCKLARSIERATVYGTGLIGGIVSHVFLDMLPHGDYLAHYGWLIPDSLWMLREILAALLILLLVVILPRGWSKLAALAAGIGGALPELDNLAIGMGLIKRSQALSPSHSGIWPHGQNLGVTSFAFEIGLMLLAVLFLYSYRWLQTRSAVHRGTAGQHIPGRVGALPATPVRPSGSFEPGHPTRPPTIGQRNTAP
jgi:hypothetical protein